MKFQDRTEGDVVVITLEGEMVGGPDAALLSEKLRELLEQQKNRIVLDMTKVDWMNSSGLGILIGSLTTVRNSGGDLKLFNLSGKLQELLRITKLRCVFEVFDDVEGAIGSFA